MTADELQEFVNVRPFLSWLGIKVLAIGDDTLEAATVETLELRAETLAHGNLLGLFYPVMDPLARGRNRKGLSGFLFSIYSIRGDFPFFPFLTFLLYQFSWPVTRGRASGHWRPGRA